MLVGREIASAPTVLMTAYAVRGLDINSSYTIYNLINAQKEKGTAVIFVGEDLDVLLELSDRILVLCGGRVSGILDGRTADKNTVGMMMTRIGGGEEREQKERNRFFILQKGMPFPGINPLASVLVAIAAALVVCGILTTVLTGINPIQVYVSIFMGAFGTARKTWITLQNVAILLLIALALTPAFRMRFWNIGGEGQVLIGGLAAAACMICLAGKLPNVLIIVLMVVCSLGAGAIWGLIPAFFKAKWNTE